MSPQSFEVPAAADASASDGHALLVQGLAQGDPHWIEQLADGRHVLIRPLRPDDAELERRFLDALSPTARRFRFLGQIGHFSADMVARLTQVDYSRDAAFVALVHENGEVREVGVSRYGSSNDGQTCECAVTVADGWHHLGLGTLLMRHLISHARERGIRRMVSIDMAENRAMRELAESLGFVRKAYEGDASLVLHELAL